MRLRARLPKPYSAKTICDRVESFLTSIEGAGDVSDSLLAWFYSCVPHR
jgi:hypothetical protein